MQEIKNWVLDKNCRVITNLVPHNWKMISPYSWLTRDELEEWPYKDVAPLTLHTEENMLHITFLKENEDWKVDWKWKESTKEYFWEKLEVLPPEKHTIIEFLNKKCEFFRMSEYWASDITEHHLKIWDKYYYWNFRTWSYKQPRELLMPSNFIS